MFEARPHAVEAIAKTATPIRNIRRRPSESPSAPPARTRADKRIPYDTTTHCTSTRLAWQEFSSAGTATLTTVLSTNAMLDPRIVAAKIHGCLALAHGEAIPDDSTKPSSQGVFIKIRMLQVAGLVQPALFSYLRLWGREATAQTKRAKRCLHAN